MSNSYENKIYVNQGNSFVLDLLPKGFIPKKILDIGIGNGANTTILKDKFPEAEFHGTTLSNTELETCKDLYSIIRIEDITASSGRLIDEHTYDLVIMSHVLEHLPQPDKTISFIYSSLNQGGFVIGAVPNVLVFKNRMKILMGKWNYTQTGIMDETHLKFFSFDNIQNVLKLDTLSDFSFDKFGDTRLPGLLILSKLGLKKLRSALDKGIGGLFPNTYAWQIAFRLGKK